MEQLTEEIETSEIELTEQFSEGTSSDKMSYVTWEHNHRLITKEIQRYLKMNECMPTKTELADITGLSRFTIHKHIKAYCSDALVKEEEESYRMMRATMLAGLFKHAMNGDPRAARLYFDVIDGRSKGN